MTYKRKLLTPFLGMLLSLLGAQQSWAVSGDSVKAILNVNIDQSCMAYMVACCDTYCTSAFIKHRIPVLFVEVVKSVDNFVGNEKGTFDMGVRAPGDNENVFDVRVWNTSILSNKIMRLKSTCFTCPLDFLEMAGEVNQMIQDDEEGEDGEGGGCGFCGLSDERLAEILSKDDDNDVEIVYDSTLDLVNWRSGCRDLLKLEAMNPLVAMECAANHIGGVVGQMGMDGISNMLDDLFGDGELCVGVWGALYPRQMRTYNSEIISAAYAAYRAIHIAGRTLKTTGFNTTKSGVLQMAWPDMAKCYHPGADILKVESQAPDASRDGTYGFYWWVDTGCCREWSYAGSCYSEMASDEGGEGGGEGGGESVMGFSGFGDTSTQLGIEGGTGDSCGSGSGSSDPGDSGGFSLDGMMGGSEGGMSFGFGGAN